MGLGVGQWVWQSNLCALPPGQHASHSSTASVSVTDKVIYIHVVLYSLVPGLSVLTIKHKEACVCCRALVLIVLVAGTGSGFVWSRSPDWFIQEAESLVCFCIDFFSLVKIGQKLCFHTSPPPLPHLCMHTQTHTHTHTFIQIIHSII